MKLLSDVTYLVVSVPSKEDSHSSGIVATVEMCYGDGQTSVGQIQLRKAPEGHLIWRVPHVATMEGGREIQVPVFRGKLLDELCKRAGEAVRRIKQEMGRPEYGKRYRLTERTIEVLGCN